MEILPAILAKDFAELNEKLDLIASITNMVQVDICDGTFTPKASWPYKKEDDNFSAIIKEDKGMPHWEELDFEIDLMIKDPELHLDHWITAGARRIIIHAESTKNIDRIIGELQGLVEIGIAINLDTPVDDIAQYIHDIDVVQLMGIEQIGFQGQVFDERVLEKARELKQRFPDRLVSVDGGVNIENAQQLRDAGVDRLIVGSAIFGAENPGEAYDEFVML